MNPFNRFRLVHWMIAGLILACYFTEDSFERLHVWLGYGLIVFLIVRLILALKKLGDDRAEEALRRDNG